MPSSTSSCSVPTTLSTPSDQHMNNGWNRVHTVALDTDEVTQEMAARLTIALLGQILYMKGQVPFPVASLGRMMNHQVAENASRTTTRAKRRRFEFLQSFDDLTSHLRTTFVALSTALAKNENEFPICSALTSTSSLTTEQNSSNTSTEKRRHPAKVYILLILGPSPTTAKARYLLEIDGFRVEQFGEWQYSCCDGDHGEQEQCSTDSNNESSNSSKLPSPRCIPILTTAPERSPSEALGEHDSPYSSSSLDTSCPVSVPPSPSASSDDGGSSECSIGFQEELDPFILEQRAEEVSLRTAERLLYRTLVAGDEGLGFGDEISPTQIHVFIRAPRRFTHPTWVPRQTLGSTLDRHVQNFLESESDPNNIRSTKSRNHTGFGVGLRTVGIRVQCQRKKEGAEGKSQGKIHSSNKDLEDKEDGNEIEEDELIWWNWNGKLVGFTD